MDLIVAIFVSIILIFFSFGTYKLLTIDIIYQISPIFKDPNISNSINTDRLFNNFKLQTIFFLSVSDIVIFILSIFFFDKMVKKMLTPIEYLSNLQTKFAEHVSHELRTPLSILKLHTEILEDKIQQEKNKSSSTENIFLEKSEKSIQDILKEIENIKILINDLLFEARLRYGEQKKDKITLKELQDLILEIVEKANYFKNKDVKFFLKNNFQDEDLSKFLSIFKKHLERVFNNLISNSFKFTENGKVEVDLEIYKNKNKKYLKIQIFDTGLGIKKSDLKKSFGKIL